MATDPKHLSGRPEADTEAVEDLVARVMRGTVRIPSFQRGLRWESKDVVSLYESIYRGYPVGSLLLRKGPAEAGVVEIGPLRINAPETQSALWVIDGQQRLTALTAGLARPTPIPTGPVDAFVVYFDAETRTFHAPPKEGIIPSTWVPVAHLLDASELSEWIFNWAHSGDPRLRSAVFQAGTRLRQYRVPLYIVETDDEEVLRDIFFRTNSFGKSLLWTEVHDAVFGNVSEHPTTLQDLADELNQLGMGRPDQEQLHSCLIAYKGMDVTRSFAEHYRRDPEVLRDAVRDALPAIRRVMSFLRIDAQIPHLRLLPRSLPLVVLTRFYHLFPDPNPRTRNLLARWTWRTLLSTPLLDERTLLRHGVMRIREGDVEGSAQELLALVPRSRSTSFALPQRFDARAAESRLALLGMAALKPMTPDGEPVDVAALIEERGVAAFRSILPRHEGFAKSPANRILLPGDGSARKDLPHNVLEHEHFLASHGIGPEAMASLTQGDADAFLQSRALVIETAVRELGDRLTGWGQGSDRPSIDYLLHMAEAED